MSSAPPAPQAPSPPSDTTSKPRDIQELLDIMVRLRSRDGGCPWDVEQTFATVAPYTIEEAYEVADAIARQNMPALKDELGDLLFQVVFHARIAEEANLFRFADVVGAISDKMVHRHPHVFGSTKFDNLEAQTAAWENLKAAERDAARAPGTPPSVLDGLPASLPALKQAEKLQKRAARVGFDWTDAKDILGKIQEELDEVRAEFRTDGQPTSTERLSDELGDLLFACVNLARKAGIDPGMALRGTNLKFERRFRRVEALLRAAGKAPEGASLDEMEELWIQAKHEERG
jgi:ATP diphosphatase